MNYQDLFNSKPVLSSFLLLVSIVFVVKSISVVENPKSFDEADYIKAASKGIFHNALGKETLNLKEFIELGNLKVKHNNKGPEVQAYVENVPPASDDVFMLRHYHPPLPIYYWKVFMNISKDSSEELRILRISNFILYLIYIFLFGIGAYCILGNEMWSWATVFPIVLIALTPLTFYVFRALNLHAFFSCGVLFFLVTSYRFLKNDSRLNSIMIGVSAGLLTVTLETSAFILGTSLLGFFLLGFHKKVDKKSIVVLMTSWLLTTAVLWPSFLLNGELIKSWGMYAYRIFGKENLEYSSVSYWDSWLTLISYAPVLFIWISINSILAITKFRKERILIFCLMVSASYALVMTPFILNKTYVYPAYSGLLLVSILVANRIQFKNKDKILALGSVLFVLYIGFFKDFQSNNLLFQKSFAEDLSMIDSITENGSSALVQNGHIFSSYLPGRNISLLDNPLKNQMKFTIRFDYMHKDISDDLKNKKYAYVIMNKDDEIQPLLDDLSEYGYDKIEETISHIYYSL